VSTVAVANTTMMSPTEAATYLRQKWQLHVDEDEVRRWVRHGRVAGTLDDHGRVTVDVAGLDALLVVKRMENYGTCLSMVDMEEHIRRARATERPKQRQEPVLGPRSTSEGTD